MKWTTCHDCIEVWNSFADHVGAILELTSRDIQPAVGQVVQTKTENTTQLKSVFIFSLALLKSICENYIHQRN